MADREFLLKIVGDVSSAQKSIGELEKDVGGFKDTAKSMGKAIVGAIAVDAVVQAGKAVVGAASDQEQAIGALRSVYGDYAKDMEKFGDTTAENMGISKAEFSQLAAVTGSMMKNAGVPLDEVASSTKALTERAADMAAMFGGNVPDAMNAINSALKGERDPIEKYGVSIKETAVQAKALEMGLVDAEGKATDYGKSMATQALIMEQSADAAGTFKDESKSLAGQQAIMSAQFKDTQAQIGQALMPAIVAIAGVIRDLVTFVKDNTDWLLPLAAGIIAVVLAIKAWQAAQVIWNVAVEAGTAIQWLFNAAMTANPIGIVIVAIAALVAAFVLLYTKVDWFRQGVDTAIDAIMGAFQWLYNWVRDNWPLLLAILTGPFGLAVLAIQRNWDSIKGAATAAVEFIRQAVSTVWDIISYPFKRGADLVLAAWNPVRDFFGGLYNAINNAFHGLADVIKYPFQIAFDAIKRLWNSTVGGFGFEVPSWVPFAGGKSFHIPEMAKGGIVNGPTVALLGEAGPEAVVPLSRGGSGFGSVTINVYALTANAEVGRKVYEALQEYGRTSGRAIA